jgi:hypothetical protein
MEFSMTLVFLLTIVTKLRQLLNYSLIRVNISILKIAKFIVY